MPRTLHRRVGTLLLLAAICIGSEVGVASDRVGKAKVLVLDSNATPVPDAVVTIGHPVDVYDHGRSDENGSVEFGDLEQSHQYWVGVAIPHCYLVIRGDLAVWAGKTLAVHVQFIDDYCPRTGAEGPTGPTPHAPGTYVPKDVKDAVIELRRALHPDRLRDFDSDQASSFRWLLGQWIKTSWDLAGKREPSPLFDFFRGLGIDRPSDMRAILIESLSRSVAGKPVDVETQIHDVVQYWHTYAEHMAPPTGLLCPEHDASLVVEYEVDLSHRTTNAVRVLHVLSCPKTGEPWVFEHDKGLYEPDPQLRSLL